ncbi:hypothetical protein GF389_03485 [Candidatus Dojkabacteria bacterium]|nr:hypothetical protein [Candidatus Dojkabacteria bacterium]
MQTDKVPQNTLKLMPIVAKMLPEDSYLAGGTALTLHLNHRKSFDLDLYSPRKFQIEEQVQRFEEGVESFKLTSTSWQTVLGKSGDTEISLFYYKYKLLWDTSEFQDLEIASIEDIAAMKIEAISGRGLKRDYFDIFSICQLGGWDLSKIVNLNQKKYERNGSNMAHILKSLVYFGDAESFSERAEEVEESWREVKRFFEIETRRLVKLFL